MYYVYMSCVHIVKQESIRDYQQFADLRKSESQF
jgi:hypothetical protein